MAKSNYTIDSVRLHPLDFIAGEGYVGTVMVDTIGAPFAGTIEIFEGELFAVVGNVISSAPLPTGSYSLTLLLRDSGQVYYSMQTVTARGPAEVVIEPPPEPSTDNTMTLTNISGATVTNHPLQFARSFVQGEIANYAQITIGGTPIPTQCDVKNRWPDGSVKFAIMAAVVSSLPSGTPNTVAFINTVTANNTPSDLSTVAAYDARINLTNPVGGATAFASAKDMLTAGKYTLWTSGPIAQTYVCCDRSAARIYDIGWSSNRAIHPWFVVTVWPALGKVFTRFVAEISNTEAMEAQTYNLALTVAGTGVYSQSGVAHLPATRWSRAAWYGGAPEPAVNLYHNVVYLAQTKMVPKYDPAIVIPSTKSATRYADWLASDHSIGGPGYWQPYMPTAGGRLDIGLNPAWNVAALLSGDYRDLATMLGQAELAGWWKRHIREGDTTKANFGRTIHSHTRGTYWFLDDRVTPSAADEVVIINPGVANEWSSDTAHHSDPHTIPYIITGDPYWLDALEMWHGANSLLTQPAYRNYAHMACIGDYQTRAMGWIYRTMFNAATLMPDADPLSSVFKTMVDEAVAYDEGVRHINTTAFAGNTMHAHGASGIGTTGDGWGGFGVPPCRWWSGSGAYFATDPAFYNTAITWGAGAHWMQNFVIAALGRGRELGFPVDALITWVAPFVIGQFIAPWKPQLNSQYNVPDTKKVPPTGVDGTWFTSWTDAFTGWSAQKQTGIMDGQLEMVYWGLGETYYNKARTALAFVVDQPNGATAWTNCEATMAAKAAESGISTAWVDDPTWSVIA